MENQVLEVAASQGIWTVLSIFLLFYIIRAQEKRDEKQDAREEKYNNIIQELTYKLNIVEDIKTDINDIKGQLKNICK